MAKTRKNDDSLMVVAKGLSTLAVGLKFTLNEADDVHMAFAAIAATVERSLAHEKRIKDLEDKLKKDPMLKKLLEAP